MSDTIAVDRGWQIHADPAVLEGMAVDDLGRLLVHLVSHLLRDHARPCRPGRRRKCRWRPTGLEPGQRRRGKRRLGDRGDGPAVCRRDCRPPSAPKTGSWPSSTTSSPAAAPGNGIAVPGVTGSNDHGTIEATVSGSTSATASSCASAWRARCSGPRGWSRGPSRRAGCAGPSKSFLLAPIGARVLAAEVQTGVARVSGMVDYSYRRPSRRVGVHAFGDHADARAPGARRRHRVRHVGLDDRVTSWRRSWRRSRPSSSESACGAPMCVCCPAMLRCTLSTCEPSVAGRTARRWRHRHGRRDHARRWRFRPRPSIVVVLTDGFTPWPVDAPRGAKVIVGLIEGRRGPGPWSHGVPPAPTWAKTVRISHDDLEPRASSN